MISVRAPARLHHIALGGGGWLTGGWAKPLNIDHDARNLRDRGIPDILLHERKARSAGRSHGLQPPDRGADDRRHAGNLILHLDELAADLWKLAGHGFCHLGRRRDWITGVETAARGERSLRNRLVALHESDSQA